MTPVHIIGAGLAGSEAAYFLARHGVAVHLHEMRPARLTEAHKTGNCAELVCSNSLKSKAIGSAPALLKQEMRAIGSLVLDAAARFEVPAGDALSVDRELFSAWITEQLRAHPLITFVPGEVSEPIPDAINLICTGPLTAESLTSWIARNTGHDDLYFYDAIAPIIDASTIDMTQAFMANRYDKGGEQAYINCPMNEQQYNAFLDALIAAEKVPAKNFEKEIYFQGCQPIEAIAATGRDTLRFGPMKPVGLVDPISGRRPYAAIQLRSENKSKSAYNMVGFQTRLKWGEQSKVFRLIPGLGRAEFLRLGSIHRNTYVCSPRALRGDLSLKKNSSVYFAGQITGVEGYLESSASGLTAAMFILQRIRGERISAPPANTAMGALLGHVIGSDEKNFQPNNIQFGLFDLTLFNGIEGLGKKEIKDAVSDQSWASFSDWMRKQSLETSSPANIL